jgi:hypothetical protein
MQKKSSLSIVKENFLTTSVLCHGVMIHFVIFNLWKCRKDAYGDISYCEERNNVSVFAKGEFYIFLNCLTAIVKYIIRHLIKMSIVRTEGPRATSCFMK